MAPRTKKPHFVPAAYLQFWNFDGTAQGRESKVWWCDGKQCQLQSVGNMAVQANLYSPKNPNAAEAYFGEFEVNWAKLVGQLISGRPQRREILHRCQVRRFRRSCSNTALARSRTGRGDGRAPNRRPKRPAERLTSHQRSPMSSGCIGPPNVSCCLNSISAGSHAVTSSSRPPSTPRSSFTRFVRKSSRRR
jgi:hypothetical protein